MEKNYDRRLRQTLFPVRVVKTFGNISNHEALLKEKPLQIGLNEPDCTVFENGETGEMPPFCLISAGRSTAASEFLPSHRIPISPQALI